MVIALAVVGSGEIDFSSKASYQMVIASTIVGSGERDWSLLGSRASCQMVITLTVVDGRKEIDPYSLLEQIAKWLYHWGGG